MFTLIFHSEWLPNFWLVCGAITQKENRKQLRINNLRFLLVLEAGLEPAQPQWPRDFKSLVSTDSTIRATLYLFYSRKRFSSMLFTATTTYVLRFSVAKIVLFFIIQRKFF